MILASQLRGRGSILGRKSWQGIAITNIVQAWENNIQTSVTVMKKIETSLKNVSISSQNHMEHGQSKKPVFKNLDSQIGVHPMQGELKRCLFCKVLSSVYKQLFQAAAPPCWMPCVVYLLSQT